MGKKSSGKHYVSKGERSSVSKKILRACRRERSSNWKMGNIIKHWSKGENPWITIENPNKEQTNKKFIRARSNDVWGPPRPAQIKMRHS